MPESLLVHFLLSSICILSLSIDLNHALRNDSVNLSFIVQKNQTGHIITKWSVMKGSSLMNKNLKIDFSSGYTENGGMHFFHLQGLISVPPPKPADYELFPGIGYYKFHQDGATSFDEASSICSKEGGHLAIINSKAESSVLGNIYARHPQAMEFAWIGFHDQDVEGNYVTIYGTPLGKTGFTEWKQSEPNNAGGNEDCGSLFRGGGLNDLQCNGTWPFFCEYDLAWLGE